MNRLKITLPLKASQFYVCGNHFQPDDYNEGKAPSLWNKYNVSGNNSRDKINLFTRFSQTEAKFKTNIETKSNSIT